MRLESWREGEVFNEITETALKNANGVMDDVVTLARSMCPVGTISRPGGWSSANVAFTPKTGKNKGTPVSFHTDKQWKGREPGDLRNTIRRVNRKDSGNIRVYAGNFKIYWAFMVERGTIKTRPQPFLRPAFQQVQTTALEKIKNGTFGGP